MTRSAYGLDLQPDVDWARDAACRHDPELWFNSYAENESLARHVCLSHCPVASQCHTAAQRKRPVMGVEGGVLWTREDNLNVGRPARDQPTLIACGKRCWGWRH